MLVRAKAPLRVSFGGGGTDVPPFPQEEGGCVLNATINRYAAGTFRPRTDHQICVDSVDFGLSVRYSVDEKLVYNGKLDLVKAAILQLDGQATEGFDLFLHTDAPPGSGLGASSAMMVTLVGLLRESQGLPMTDYEVADVAYCIERKTLGIQGGMQDQYAAAFGGFNYMEFLPDRVIVNPLKVSPDVINELQYNMLLCYTGSMRLSSNIIREQVARYEARNCETTQALREIKQLAVEMKNVLLLRKLNEFGRLLHEEWAQKKRMADSITNSQLDDLYERARQGGAIGGKITGAGGGGYMLLYCEYDRKHRVAQCLRELGCTVMDFAFEPAGLQTWRVNGN